MGVPLKHTSIRRNPLEFLSLDLKYQRLDKEKEREQMIRENAAKDEIIKELRRRKTLETWDKKIEMIEKTKEKNLAAKVFYIYERRGKKRLKLLQQRI